MKLLILLISSLFNQDAYLVKQGGIEVPLSDLDAYVYLLKKDKRGGFAVQQQQIEKNVFTLLNINIVYQHILNSDLKDLDRFKDVIKTVNEDEWIPETVFLEMLDLESKTMEQSVRSYVIKREYYKTLLAYLEETTTEEMLKNSIKEYFMVNKAKFIKPAKRDLSVIMLDEVDTNDSDAILNELKSSDQASFQIKASEISTDPSKSINEGHWGEFRENQFNYAFKEKVFNAPLGVIPEVLTDKGTRYIIRVNKIVPSEPGKLADAKTEIYQQLKKKAVKRKFQSIINAKVQHEIEVNPELIAHIFERYKVFIEE